MEAARVVEVHAGKYGTGYRVAPGLILTAKHLVTEPDQIEVRLLEDQDRHHGKLAWESAEFDAALISMDARRGPRLGPVRWGRFIGTKPGVPWELAGFPRAQRLADRRRGVEALRGELDPMMGAPHSVQLQLAELGARVPSPWQGISGAVVTCYGLVSALVTDSMLAYGHRRLAALPVERLFADPTFCRALQAACGSDPLLEPVELAPILTTPAQFAPRPAPGLSPTSLLRADAGAISFHGRAEELQRLLAWCEGSGFELRLLTGPGGHGKTCLARQVAQILQGKGWAIGWLVPEVDLMPVRDRLAGLTVSTLLVVDYAESRTKQVKDLLVAATNHPGPGPLRILLIARTGGDWWRQLATDAARELRDVLNAASIDEIAPFPVSDRNDMFVKAARGLAEQIGGSMPGSVWRPDLSAERYGSPLRIAMEALATLLAPSHSLASNSAEDIILDHERPYWSTAARAYELNLEPEDQRSAVAAATLCGGADQTEALTLLRQLPGLGDETDDGHQRRRRAARWLHDLYPGPTNDVDSNANVYWGSLQPDLLAEHLVATVAREDAGFLARVLAKPSDAQARQALRVLSRAALHHPDVATWLIDLIAGRLDLARVAIAVVPQVENPTALLSAQSAAVDRIPRQPESLDLLWGLAGLLPVRSQLLDDLKLQIYQTIAGIHLSTDALHMAADQESFAAAAANFSKELAQVGRNDLALPGFQLATSYYAWFAEQDPGRFLPQFARVLTHLSEQLANAGQRDNAIATIGRALSISERLASEDPDAHASLLASALSTFAGLFPRTRTDEALAAMRRAVGAHEQRAAKDPDAQPALAEALNSLAAISMAAGQTDEALAAAQRAAGIYDRLATANPDAFQRGLARSLYNLTALLAHNRQFDQALATAEKMAPVWADLAKLSLARGGRDFLHAMLMLGFLRLESGQPRKAAAPLASVISLGRAVNLDDIDTAPLQAARLLRTAYRQAPRDVTKEWGRITGEQLPAWLRDERSDLTDDEADWYRQVAETGDSNAIRHLASLHERRGEAAEAERWYRNAAEAGDRTAMTRLGDLLRRQARQEEAEPWWLKAAQAGDTHAMTNLAMLLMIRGELAEAEGWSRRAAELGHIGAMNVLGTTLLQRGEPAEAETWWRRSAYAGDSNAANNLLGLIKVKREAGEDALRTATGVQWNRCRATSG
jgi:tetratricopeptide (TPR) repeat protein